MPNHADAKTKTELYSAYKDAGTEVTIPLFEVIHSSIYN